jgi:hypothetical protein
MRAAPINATVASAQGIGTIVNDDASVTAAAPIQVPTLGEWSLLALVCVTGALGLRRVSMPSRPKRIGGRPRTAAAGGSMEKGCCKRPTLGW